MIDKPHIVRIVADESRRLYFHRQIIPLEQIRPRIVDDEIGVELKEGVFIPYADLGYSGDIGFFRLSETFGVENDALPYAASGKLIDCGQIMVTTSASQLLDHADIFELVQRHSTGDFGEYGEFYTIDITDEMLADGDPASLPVGMMNKINTLTGLNAVISEYVVGDSRIWVITEAGENRSTLILLAGTPAD